MNFYETILIFNGKYTEARYNTLVDKYVEDIIKLDALIGYIDRLGKKKLAYEIKGTKEGWYVIINYKATPELIPKLERLIRTDDSVIKFMTIKRDPEEDELEKYAEVEKMPGDHPEKTKSEQESSEIDYFNLIYNIS